MRSSQSSRCREKKVYFISEWSDCLSLNKVTTLGFCSFVLSNQIITTIELVKNYIFQEAFPVTLELRETDQQQAHNLQSANKTIVLVSGNADDSIRLVSSNTECCSKDLESKESNCSASSRLINYQNHLCMMEKNL